MKALIILVFILISLPANAARLQKESVYRAEFCEANKQVTLRDKTRADCFKDGYAVEVDFADKWAEGHGQAIHYAIVSNLKPMVVLIIEKQTDCKHVARLTESVRKTYTLILGELLRTEVRQIGPRRCITGTITQ